ncbi:MAG: glycosyltransferase family 39 protein, partial [Terracidiphilus sp.]
MRAAVKHYLPAVACALTPILCYLLIRPYAEMGLGDDWSYIKSAQVLAQTSHIVYNGWGSPMLGWQLYLGALFIKLFGFSFTAVRFSTVIEAVATAYLLERTFVRAGFNSCNATLATMTFVLSPLYFPFAFTFMSDVSGVLCILACLYMCLRAVQARSERAAMLWISLSALVNAVGGTARQIVWLGLLVMVPCTLWLLRKSRRALVAGGISWIIGVAFVATAVHWFAGQPYTIPTPLFPIRIDWRALESLEDMGLRGVGLLALLALPVLLMFSESLRLWNRRTAAVFGIGFLCFAVSGIALIRAGKLYLWHAPFLLDFMTDSSWKRLSVIASLGIHLDPARDGLGVLLTGAVALGILFLAVCVFAGTRGGKFSPQETAAISWQKLGILLGPFSAAYIVILALTGLRNANFFDRYLLPLLAILLLVLARYYQERVKENLPWACILLVVLFAGFSLAATHDEFALYR